MNFSKLPPRTLFVGILLGGVLGTAIGVVTRDIPIGLLAGMLLGGLFVTLNHAAKQQR